MLYFYRLQIGKYCKPRKAVNATIYIPINMAASGPDFACFGGLSDIPGGFCFCILTGTIFSLALGTAAAAAAAALYNEMPARWLCDFGEKLQGVHLPSMRPRAVVLPCKKDGNAKCIETAGNGRNVTDIVTVGADKNVKSIVTAGDGANAKGVTTSGAGSGGLYDCSFFCFVSVASLSMRYAAFGFPHPQGFAFGVLCLLLLAAAAQSDKAYGIIPDELSLLVSACGAAYALSCDSPARSLLFSFLGGLAGSLTMLLTDALTRLICGREGVGMGDIKLIGACGVFLKSDLIFPMILIASLCGSLCLSARILAGRLSRDEAQPMAPWIFFAFSACLVLGAP